MTERKPKNNASTLAEGKEAPIGELKKSLARAIELLDKNHPEIVKKLKAKDVPLEEKISELAKVIEVHVTKQGVKVCIEASKTGGDQNVSSL